MPKIVDISPKASDSKFPIAYDVLISMAILRSKYGSMSFDEMLNWLRSTFVYFEDIKINDTVYRGINYAMSNKFPICPPPPEISSGRYYRNVHQEDIIHWVIRDPFSEYYDAEKHKAQAGLYSIPTMYERPTSAITKKRKGEAKAEAKIATGLVRGQQVQARKRALPGGTGPEDSYCGQNVKLNQGLTKATTPGFHDGSGSIPALDVNFPFLSDGQLHYGQVAIDTLGPHNTRGQNQNFVAYGTTPHPLYHEQASDAYETNSHNRYNLQRDHRSVATGTSIFNEGRKHTPRVDTDAHVSLNHSPNANISVQDQIRLDGCIDPSRISLKPE